MQQITDWKGNMGYRSPSDGAKTLTFYLDSGYTVHNHFHMFSLIQRASDVTKMSMEQPVVKESFLECQP